jgi:RNA polymerase sigma factor (sigma-70 family)
VESAKKFDPARGVKFTTYACSLITYAIIDHTSWRRDKSVTLRTNVDSPKSPREGGRYDWATSSKDPWADRLQYKKLLSDERTAAVDRNRRELLADMLRGLKPRCRKVLAMRFGLDGYDEMFYPEIGEALGVTGSRAQQIVTAAMKEMRR